MNSWIVFVGALMLGILVMLIVGFIVGYKYIRILSKDIRKMQIALNKSRQHVVDIDQISYGLFTRFNLVSNDPTKEDTIRDDRPEPLNIPKLVNEVVEENKKFDREKESPVERDFNNYKNIKIERKPMKVLSKEEFSLLSQDEKIEYINQYRHIVDKLPDNTKKALTSLRDSKRTKLEDIYAERCH